MRRYSREGWRQALSSNGHSFWTWEPPVPYVDPRFRDCAIYLYPSEQKAREGVAAGGSGFLVGVRSSAVPGLVHFYAVTNEHVIRPAAGPPNTVIRLNDKGGSADILKVGGRKWLAHPKGDDIAATPLILSPHHEISWIDRDAFITQADLDECQIGPGDECFMVGRLVQHDGKQRNEPVLRFGNIAMMPYDVLQSSRQRRQESFLVEMRTLSGFSGSPVIVHWVMVGPRPEPKQPKGGVPYISLVTHKAWLLGVDWGFVRAAPDVHGNQDDRRLVNSGMSAVVPAWKLAELLDRREFIVAREREEKKTEQWLEEEGAATEASADVEYARFEGLARKLIQVPKEEIDAERAEEDER
jgi:hypothetical protein